MKNQKKIKAWAVLDIGGGMKYPSVSIFDTKKEAKIDADELNKLPEPVNVKDPKNHIAKIEIIISEIL